MDGNFEITKQQITELKKEIKELRQNIEHTESVLEDKVTHMKENLGHIKSRVQEMYEYQIDLDFIEDKLTDLEDRLRRKNLRVDGIKERPNKTWEYCKKELDTFFQEIRDIDEVVLIEKEHMVKTNKNKKSNTPRNIFCKILDCKHKIRILRNVNRLKGKNIFINEDFCQATLNRHKKLCKNVKRLREEDKIACLQIGSIVIKRKDNAE